MRRGRGGFWAGLRIWGEDWAGEMGWDGMCCLLLGMVERGILELCDCRKSVGRCV